MSKMWTKKVKISHLSVINWVKHDAYEIRNAVN